MQGTVEVTFEALAQQESFDNWYKLQPDGQIRIRVKKVQMNPNVFRKPISNEAETFKRKYSTDCLYVAWAKQKDLQRDCVVVITPFTIEVGFAPDKIDTKLKLFDLQKVKLVAQGKVPVSF